MREQARPRALSRARASVAAGLLLLFGCGDASEASDPPGLTGGTGGSSATTTATSGSTGAGAQGGMTGSTTSSGASTTSGSGGALPGLRYHEIRAKSAHNAYERDEGLFDQLAYHRVRSLELDIHTDKVGWPSQKDDWYVYHMGLGEVHCGSNVVRPPAQPEWWVAGTHLLQDED